MISFSHLNLASEANVACDNDEEQVKAHSSYAGKSRTRVSRDLDCISHGLFFVKK